MSRAARRQKFARDAKRWRRDASLVAPPDGPSVALAVPQPDSNVAVMLDPMAQDVLDVMARLHAAHGRLLWGGNDNGYGVTTGTLAAKLSIRAQSVERDRLNAALTDLRRRRLVHFEYERTMDRQARWWLTDAGLAAAS